MPNMLNLIFFAKKAVKNSLPGHFNDLRKADFQKCLDRIKHDLEA